MRYQLIVSALAALSLAQGAQAQRPEQLQQGMKIRIVDTGGGKVFGILVGRDRESVTIASKATPDAPFTIAQSNLRRLEVDKGPRRLRGAALGGLIGLGIGIAAGAAVGYFTYSGPEPSHCTPDPEAWGLNCLFAGSCLMICSPGEAAAFVGIFGGGIGLVSGAIAGAIHGGHYWVKVPLPLAQPTTEKGDAASERRSGG